MVRWYGFGGGEAEVSAAVLAVTPEACPAADCEGDSHPETEISLIASL